MELREVALWALRQNYHLDRANAAVHTSPVRYSPLTFRLYEALSEQDCLLEDLDMFHCLGKDLGTYAEDPGR